MVEKDQRGQAGGLLFIRIDARCSAYSTGVLSSEYRGVCE